MGIKIQHSSKRDAQTPSKPICTRPLFFFTPVGSPRPHIPQNIPIPLPPQPLSLGLIIIWYGNGLLSLVVIGGIWSFSMLTVVTIFMAAFKSIASIAFRTLALSAFLVSTYTSLSLVEEHNRPDSVLGVASVTSRVHCSQQTSSSPFVNQAFLLFFSKNCTAIKPLTPLPPFLPPP